MGRLDLVSVNRVQHLIFKSETLESLLVLDNIWIMMLLDLQI